MKFGNAFIFPIFTTFFLLISLDSDGHEERTLNLLHDLQTVKHHFECCYAPLEWKSRNGISDFEKAYLIAESRIVSKPEIRIEEFRRILRDFCNSLHDYHTNIFFVSTEKAQLPFSVQRIEGEYLIDRIDRTKIPEHFELAVGDELLEFDGEPISTVIAKLTIESGSVASNEETDDRLIAAALTFRKGALGDSVPSGPVSIKTRSHRTGKIFTRQLIWEYEPEEILSHLNLTQSAQAERRFQDSESEGFLPFLGKILWMNDEDDNLDEYPEEDPNADQSDTAWKGLAYIYAHPEKKKIGYIRIPDYLLDSDDLRVFGTIIRKMESETDGLILDQTDNAGGDIFSMYTIVSMLISEPVPSLRQQIKLYPRFIRQVLKESKSLKKILDDRKYSGDSKNLPNYLSKMFIYHYYRFILSEWSKGKTLTDPHYLIDTDMILPHPFYNYTKPILVLNNAMTISSGEFSAAIYQDAVSDRIKLFGAKTAGAGGCNKTLSIKSHSGIDYIKYTWTLAIRSNGMLIENTGVPPDFPYTVTKRDIITGYSDYAAAVNRTIFELVQNDEEKNKTFSFDP